MRHTYLEGRSTDRRSGVRASILVGVVAAMVLAVPSLASAASTAQIPAGTDRIDYTGDAGVNSVTASRDGGDYRIEDFSGITAGTGCTQAGANAVTCPAAGIARITFDTGAGHDLIEGSPGVDIINAGTGGDVIDGNAGDDVIDPGLGPTLAEIELCDFQCFESVDGGTGFDTLDLSARTERVEVDLRNVFAFDFVGGEPQPGRVLDSIQKVIGGSGPDELIGSNASEVLNGGPGNAPDVLCGGLGIDTVDYSDAAGPVHDDLAGTMDTDLRHIEPAPNVKVRTDCREVDYNTGTGTPLAGGLRDCTPNDGVLGEGDCVGEDTENIIGSAHDDVLIGNDPDALVGKAAAIEPLGVNRLQGGDGNDLLDGGLGADVLEGGGGTDTVTYASRTEPVIASIDGAPNDGVPGQDDSPSGLSGDTILSDVEVLIGGSSDDTLRGDDGSATDDGNDQLIGGLGADFLDGGSGNDTLNGAEGGDLLVGGDGNDQLRGGPDDDTLDGETGNDDVQGESGNDFVVAGDTGADGMSGGEGVDSLDYSGASTPVRVDPNGVSDDGRAGELDNVAADFEAVFGGIDDDHLVGGPGNELLAGGDGNDRLDGGAGADVLSGGPGSDTASYEARSAPVNVNLAEAGNDGEAGENDSVLDDVEKVLGGLGDDALLGDGRANVLMGGAGNDVLGGAEGDDLLIGDVGNDRLAGDVGNDTLLGSDGDDNLSGGGGSDDLKGEAGKDTLDGGPGTDRQFGGPHVDTVLYATRSAAVSVKLEGVDNNGERNEDDFINGDVESVTTGNGGDTIDADDNKTGDVKCGGGTDIVTADPEDNVASDCESVQVSALGTRCSPAKGTLRMSKSGAIRVRVFCAVAGKGKLQLQSVARVRTGKGQGRKVLKIGSKSFSLKAGQRKVLTVKASKAARRYIQRKKRLSVRGKITAKTVGKAKASTIRASSVFTVKGPR